MAEREDFVYNSQLDAFTLYHVVQEDITPKSQISPALPALGHALAGSLATAATKALLYPLDLVVTRLQVQKKLRGEGEAASAAKDGGAEYLSIVDAASKIYRNEGGLSAFYAGCTSDVTKGLVDSFVFFLAYTFLRQRQLKSTGKKNLPVFNELAVGVVAGSFAKLLTTPLQNIVTRQQTAALIAARNPSPEGRVGKSEKLTMAQIAAQIRRERGVAGFWAGYGASLILTINPAITFAVDNILRRLLPKSRRQNPPPQLTFLIAACSKAVATGITYPVQLAKSRAQAASPEKQPREVKAEGTTKASTPRPSIGQQPSRSLLTLLLRPLAAQIAIFTALRDITREEGFAGLYSGLEGEVLKGFLSHGLTMVVKDRVHGGVIQAYYALLHLTQRYDQEVQSAREQATALVREARDRAENVGTTITEAGKQAIADGEKLVDNVSVKEKIDELRSSAVETGKNVLSGGEKMVGDWKDTAVEKGKEIYHEGAKIVKGGDSE